MREEASASLECFGYRHQFWAILTFSDRNGEEKLEDEDGVILTEALFPSSFLFVQLKGMVRLHFGPKVQQTDSYNDDSKSRHCTVDLY